MIRKQSGIRIYKNISVVLTLIIAFTTVMVSSCTKVATPAAANAKFIGTWVGSEECYNIYSGYGVPDTTIGARTYSIGSGGSDNTLNIGISFGGNNACYKASSMLAIAKDNIFTIALQPFSDNCGNSYSVRGTGDLSTGGTLTMETSTVAAYTVTCIFTGAQK